MEGRDVFEAVAQVEAHADAIRNYNDYRDWIPEFIRGPLEQRAVQYFSPEEKRPSTSRSRRRGMSGVKRRLRRSLNDEPKRRALYPGGGRLPYPAGLEIPIEPIVLEPEGYVNLCCVLSCAESTPMDDTELEPQAGCTEPRDVVSRSGRAKSVAGSDVDVDSVVSKLLAAHAAIEDALAFLGVEEDDASSEVAELSIGDEEPSGGPDA